DEQLFAALQAGGLLRLTTGGLVELAPRDLPQWQAASNDSRAAALIGWPSMDSTPRALLKRLYQQADGAYVRQQGDIFNAQSPLRAWLWQEGAIEAAVLPGDTPLETSSAMPSATARLFADPPQGWQPWTRAAHMPAAAGTPLELELRLPAAAK